MNFESFAHVPVTRELLRHVWEGEENETLGGHRFGLGRNQKTEFPEHWTIEMVEFALTETLRSPQRIGFRGKGVSCLRQVGVVVVKVKLRIVDHEYIAVTGFPVCGEGVIRNVQGRQIPQPLDLRVLEA